jgi:hypothetical protein
LPAVVPVRTLKHEFRLVLPDKAAADAFAFMAIRPEIVGRTLEAIDVPIARTHGFYTATLPGRRLLQGTAERLMGELHGIVLNDVLSSEPGAPLVHGATVLGSWGRALLIGAKGTGKTTLTLRLVAEGARIEGDEHAVATEVEGEIIARPRTMRVKDGSLNLVPELAGLVRAGPAIINWDGSRIYAVDPSVAGHPWRIAAGPLDHLVFLDANHGGRSVMRPMDRERAFRQLMRDVVLPATGVAAAVARLRSLVRSAEAHLLELGDLSNAVWHLRHL